jgi:hypothetical protein
MLVRGFAANAVLISLLLTWPAVAQAQYVWCPPGTRPVPGGGGNMCLCPDGSYASIYGCRQSQPQYRQPVGDYCNNGGTCPVGSRCSWMAGRCVPNGMVDCGSYYCTPGNKCSSGGCIPQAASDCGGGHSCPAGSVCWVAPADLGTIKRGQRYCPTAEQAAQLNSQIAAAREQKKREEEARKEAKRRELEQKREEARRKAEERREAAKRKREEERKRAEERRFDAHLRAIARDRRANPVARRIAAIALGKDPSDLKKLRLTGKETSFIDRNVVKLALGKVDAKHKNANDDQLRTIVNDPKQPLVSRRLAAAVLGTDLNKTASGAASAASPPASKIDSIDWYLCGPNAICQRSESRKNVGNAGAALSNTATGLAGQINAPSLAPSPASSASASIDYINYLACTLQNSPSFCRRYLSPISGSGSLQKGGNSGTAPPNTASGLAGQIKAPLVAPPPAPNVSVAESSSMRVIDQLIRNLTNSGQSAVSPISGSGSPQNVGNAPVQSNNPWRGLAGQMKIATITPPAGSSPSNGAGPSTQIFKPIDALNSPSTFIASTSPFLSAVQTNATSKSPLEQLNEFYQSPIGQTVADVGAAAGGAVAPKPLQLLGKLNTIGNAVVLYRQGDYLGLAQAGVDTITKAAAEGAGGLIGAQVGTAIPGVGPIVGTKVGAAIGAGSATLVLDVGKYTVAPALGNVIYYLDQQPMRPPTGTGVWQPQVPSK